MFTIPQRLVFPPGTAMTPESYGIMIAIEEQIVVLYLFVHPSPSIQEAKRRAGQSVVKVVLSGSMSDKRARLEFSVTGFC